MRDRPRIAATALLLGLAAASPPAAAQDRPRLLGPAEVTALPSAPPDLRLYYGPDSLHFGELRLPAGAGPFPVAVVVHGGCWLARFADLQNTAPLADALRRAGIASWNVEYRRADHPGGGWPGTFHDVARATDFVRDLAGRFPLDTTRVLAIGHSAGGHLALWLGARHRLPAGSDLATGGAPLRPTAAISLGGPGDVHAFVGLDARICGEPIMTRLMGGGPDAVPDRFRDASPAALLPAGIPQRIVAGERDGVVPVEHGEGWQARARAAGDAAAFVQVPGGHFEVIAPGSAAWPTVLTAARELLGVGAAGTPADGAATAARAGGAASGAPAAGAPAASGAAASPPDRTLLTRVDSLFAAYDRRDSPGCALAVARDGRVALARGYGMASLEHEIPITPRTRFYAASVSKQFAAFAVALLAGDGRLSLDDDVRRWIPELPDFGRTITVRHLVHHTSGLRDYFGLLGLVGWTSDGPLTERAFLELVSRQRALNFEPGSEFLYSNTGYVLLAVLVERVSGQSLRTFAAERIFRPLGMTASEFRDDHTRPIPGRAEAYVRAPDGWRISVPGFDVVGDGGLYTTVEDLARWDANFDGWTVGGEATGERVLTRGRLGDGSEIAYAFGLSIGDWRGQHVVQHGGSYGGYRAAFFRLPDARLTVSLLCNAGPANPGLLAQQVAELFVGDRLGPAPIAGGTAPQPPAGQAAGQGARALDAATLAGYAGTFYSDELDSTWRVVVEDEGLVVRRVRVPDLRLAPGPRADTFVAGPGMTLEFARDANGRVAYLEVSAGRIRGVRFERR